MTYFELCGTMTPKWCEIAAWFDLMVIGGMVGGTIALFVIAAMSWRR